jgi:hypothetical protein
VHDLVCWEELHRGDSQELVLAVCRPLFGPTGADLRDAAPLLETEHTVWQALPGPAGHRPSGLDLDAYLVPWTDDVRARGLRVRAVLGLGPGGLFAGVIGAAVARLQGRSPAVLLPDAALGEPVAEQFRRLVASVSRQRRRTDPGALDSAAGLTQAVLDLTAVSLSAHAATRPRDRTPAWRIGALPQPVPTEHR